MNFPNIKENILQYIKSYMYNLSYLFPSKIIQISSQILASSSSNSFKKYSQNIQFSRFCFDFSFKYNFKDRPIVVSLTEIFYINFSEFP